MKKLLIVGMLAMACNQHQDPNVLDKQLMDLHDEVMKESNQILNLKSKLNTQIDTCSNKTFRDSLQQASYQLHKADQNMLEWMHHYQEPSIASDTAIAFYQTQIQYMNQLKAETVQAIQKAKNLLHENN